MNVSIIYVNYKTCGLILDSIRTVKEQTKGVTYEIIVVDNHSEDDSERTIREQYPEVIYIASDSNLGFGKANNLGIEAAKGECIFFLNPDTLLINNAISIMYNYLQAHDDVGACGGNLYDEKGIPTTSFCRVFPSYTQEFLSIFYLPYRTGYFNHTDDPQEVASITGADLMVKRNIIDQTKGFDPAFFMNYEETEWCYRIWKKGYKIVSLPDAKITHLEGRASYIKQSRLFYLYEGQYIYFYKKDGIKGARRIFLISQLKNNMRLLLFYVLWNKRKRDYWKMKKETNRQAYEQFKSKCL